MAAGRRGRGGRAGRSSAVAGTHGKSTTAGWLVHVLVAAGADPSAFVGRAPAGGADRRAARHRPPGRRARVRRRGGRVRRQLRSVPTRHRGPHQRRVGPPGRVRRSGGRGRRVRGLAPADARRRHARRQRRPTRASRPSSTGCSICRCGSSPTPSSTTSPGRGGYLRGIARSVHDGGRARDRAARPDRRVGPRRHDARGLRARRARRGGHGPARHGRAPQRRQRAGGRRSGRRPRARSRPRSRPASAAFTGVGRRLERKGEAGGVVVYDDYGHHPTAIRETLAAVRQREPGRRVWAVYEPLTYHRTAAMLEAFADAPRRGGRGRHRRHLGRPRPGHDDHVAGGPRRPRSPRGGPAIPVARPGLRRGDRRLAGRAGPGRRRRPRHGRRPQLPDRRAAAPAPWRPADDRLRGRADACSTRMTRGLGRLRRRRAGWRCSATTPTYHEDPFAPPLVGHNALRAYLLEAAADRADRSSSPSSATGSSATHDPGRLARELHPTGRTGARRSRLAGFLPRSRSQRTAASLAPDEWYHRRETPATG